MFADEMLRVMLNKLDGMDSRLAALEAGQRALSEEIDRMAGEQQSLRERMLRPEADQEALSKGVNALEKRLTALDDLDCKLEESLVRAAETLRAELARIEGALQSRIKETEDVAAQNAFDVQRLKRRV